MGWNKKPSSFGIQVLAQADEQVRKIAGDMLTGVVTSSPVDTGQFRSNHRVSLNIPDDTTQEQVENPASTTSKGLNILKSAKIGGLVYIQNSLPYAERLESGYSQQAPSGVYSTTFAAVSEKYR